jgi:hypothetical protein
MSASSHFDSLQRVTRTPETKPSVKASSSSSHPPAPLVMRSRLSFVLYALGVIGCLSTITALIERAAP